MSEAIAADRAAGVGGDGEVPCIVMAHCISAVKEMQLDECAEVFADAGLACRVYDNRGFGASDAAPGKPRRGAAPGDRPLAADPRLPARDHLPQLRPEVDVEPIGVWGSR